ncbi:MAG TPA: endolytic transglycosylase MltG [Mycobacteriales bacterium]|nr:endolytic transglycosylase MltG [Mycobacteriales bacterium]
MTHDPDDLFVETEDRAPRKRRRPGLVVAVLIAVLALLAGGAAVGGRRVYDRLVGTSAPDYPGPGQGEVVVQVPSGATASSIALILAQQDVVKSAGAFREAAVADDRSLRIQPGFYRLRKQMRAADVIELLLDPSARIRGRVTIPEGTSVGRTLELIASSVDDMPIADLQRAAKDPAALGLPSYAGGRLEGFLFPATYDVEPGTTAVEVLQMMVARYEQAAAKVGLVERAAELKMTPLQVLTVASLVEAETPKDDQRGKVSRVVYNRLEKGQRLEFDSTIKYVFAERGEVKTRILFKDLDVASPYNTYRNAGLPPGPINSPGEDSMLAAVDPEPGPWLFFVVIDKAGNSAFSESYAEFLRNRDIYRCEVLGEC